MRIPPKIEAFRHSNRLTLALALAVVLVLDLPFSVEPLEEPFLDLPFSVSPFLPFGASPCAG